MSVLGHNAALNCSGLKAARYARRFVELEGDQTRWLPWTSRLAGAAASSAGRLRNAERCYMNLEADCSDQGFYGARTHFNKEQHFGEIARRLEQPVSLDSHPGH